MYNKLVIRRLNMSISKVMKNQSLKGMLLGYLNLIILQVELILLLINIVILSKKFGNHNNQL